MKKKKVFYLMFFLIILTYLVGDNIFLEKNKYFKEMIRARENTKILFEEIKQQKIKLGITIDEKLDINKTGIIGEEFTGLTTTMGDLDSKRLSTNSNFSAYFVKILKEANLKEGDKVFVNMSSSFPGLNLSLISALDILKLEGIIINSIGASMYGANNEEFIFLEMVEHLYNKKMIKNKILAYSYGGDWDIGGNFIEETKENIGERIKNLNIKKIYNKNINENLEERIKFYNSYGEPRYFFNVGGNLVFERLENYYKKRNIPTTTMLNIKFIGSKVGISIQEKENIKNVGIYYNKNSYVKEFLILAIFILGIILIRGSLNEKKK